MFTFIGRLAPIMAVAVLGASPAAALDARKGSLVVSQPWSRATAPRASVGAGFLTVANRGKRADRLVAASSPRSDSVEIHTMTLTGGIMRMRPLPNGIVVPPGEWVRLAPGGNHLMLIGLKRPLRTGDRVPVELRFERAGNVAVSLAVQGPGAERSASEGDRP